MAQIVRPPKTSDEAVSSQTVPTQPDLVSEPPSVVEHESDGPEPPQEAEISHKHAADPRFQGSPSPKRTKRGANGSLSIRDYRLESEIDYVPPSTVGNADSAAAKGSRLVITQLVMNNFKSYYGRQIVGPFNDNFSAVIGPNGSGKSNVIDALLFVFGWKSRELRQEKVTGLIHKSSAHTPDNCSVEVHFADTVDNKDGTTTRVPDSELVVSRHVKMLGKGARSDHTTFFQVNGIKRSYKEVREMLQDRGIDLTHRRFLILQGEVENIAMMKPKGEGDRAGLLEYLEDIIGTDKYVSTLNELLEKSDELRDAVLVSQSKVKASDETYKLINQERQNCFDAYNYQNQIAVNKYTLESRQLRDQQESLENKSVEFKEVRSQLAEVEASQQAAQEQCNTLTATIKELTNLHKKDSGELRDLQAALKKVAAELAKASALVNQSESKKTKLEKEAATAQSSVDATAVWLDNFDSDMDRLESNIQSTRDSLERDEKELEKLRGVLAESIKPLTAEVSKKQAEAEPWRVQIQTKQNELASFEQLLQDSDARVAEAKSKHEKFKADLQAKANGAKEAKQAVKDYERDLAGRKQELEVLEPEYDELKKQIPILQEAARQSHAAYSQAADSSKNAQSQSNLAVKLQEFAAKNGLEGYYGRLGNLGAIDARYDIAISTACPRLDQFVTQDIGTAEKCIKFLRSSGIGRATFIALDKLKGDPSRSNIRPCEKVSRLIDLIQPRDPKFVKAFYFATGDTVVANDINQARRVAYESNPRLKTVTLKGDVIAVSGAMSGGGRPSSGKMGSSNSTGGVSAAELARLRKQMDDDEYALASAEAKFRDLTGKIEQTRAHVSNLEGKLQAQQKILDEARATLNERNDMKRQLRSTAEAVEEQELQRRASAEQEMANVRGELSTLESKSAQLEAQIKDLRNQILDKGGVELRVLDSKVLDQRTRIKELVRQQNDKESEKMMQAKKLEKAKSSYSNATRSLEKLVIELESAAEQAELLRQEERRIEALLPDLERRLAEYVDRMDSSKEELSTLKESMSDAARETQQLEKTADDLSKQCEQLEKRVHAIKASVNSIKVEDMTPYIDLKMVLADPEYEAPVYGLKEMTDDELRQITSEEIKRLHAEIKEAQDKLAATVYSVDCLPEYRRVFYEWKARKDELDGQRQEFNTINDEHARITERRRVEFLEGLRVIKRYLKTMYRMITTDGNADLELRDTNDPFEGVEFTVMPPGKSWKNISNLSGGEKTLSSLALVFALHKYKPTPLYVMDEIDAALDFKNVSIIANYIREETRHGQFVVISLRNNMFELASRLIGIYKYEDCTHSVAYDPPAPF